MDEIDFPQLTGLEQAAVGSHEMFTALVGAGFTDEQAIEFCVRFMLSAIRSGKAE
jgi:hypothetical protein